MTTADRATEPAVGAPFERGVRAPCADAPEVSLRRPLRQALAGAAHSHRTSPPPRPARIRCAPCRRGPASHLAMGVRSYVPKSNDDGIGNDRLALVFAAADKLATHQHYMLSVRQICVEQVDRLKHFCRVHAVAVFVNTNRANAWKLVVGLLVIFPSVAICQGRTYLDRGIAVHYADAPFAKSIVVINDVLDLADEGRAGLPFVDLFHPPIIRDDRALSRGARKIFSGRAAMLPGALTSVNGHVQ